VPEQTTAEWEDDLRAALALGPDHVSAYGLTYEEGTPLHAWRERGRVVAVAHDDEAAMAEATVRILEGAGYGRYEISSFARPGHASRHNVAYWDGSDYLGVGAGAHSYAASPAPGRRWSNEKLPALYVAAVDAHGTAVAHADDLTEGQARAEFCFTGLRQTRGIDVDAFRRRFGLALEAAFSHVDGLIADGLAERAGERLRLTADGLRFADGVAATFL